MSNEKVYFLSCGKWLDRSEFLRYFERKVLYTVRKFSLIGKEDRIAVAFSGGKDSMVLLCILNRLFTPRGNKIIAVSIDEGIPGYRDKLLKSSEKFCKEQGIELKIFSFKKEFGFNLKDKMKAIEKLKLTNCYACSVLKRWLLNKKARELGFDAVATAHSLDDEAENIMLNILKGNPELLAKLGPFSGIARGKNFVQRIKPLYLCSTKEILLYAKLKKLPIPKGKSICPLRGMTLRVEIRKWLGYLENEHPEVKNAIVHSFLKIMPGLKEKYKNVEFTRCKKCGFPASHDICKACEMLKEIR
jgi:uncharacterized protein (TIGR00269 family)